MKSTEFFTSGGSQKGEGFCSIGASVTLSEDFSCYSLFIPVGVTVTVPVEITMTVVYLVCKGSLIVAGTFTNDYTTDTVISTAFNGTTQRPDFFRQPTVSGGLNVNPNGTTTRPEFFTNTSAASFITNYPE